MCLCAHADTKFSNYKFVYVDKYKLLHRWKTWWTFTHINFAFFRCFNWAKHTETQMPILGLLCMHTLIHTRLYMHSYVCMHRHRQRHTQTKTHTHTCITIHTHTYICLYVYWYAFIQVQLHVHTHTHMHIYTL